MVYNDRYMPLSPEKHKPLEQLAKRDYIGNTEKIVSKTGIVDFGKQFPLDTEHEIIITQLFDDGFAQIYSKPALIAMLEKEERHALDNLDGSGQQLAYEQMLANLEQNSHELLIKPNSNRAKLPPEIIEGLDLTDKVQIIGVGDHIEITRPEFWREYRQNINLSEIAEQLGKKGLRLY